MANRHFAKFGDIWKHLPLVEILAIERPNRYWESHAGSAIYPMIDDPERRYGIGHFTVVAPGFPSLDASRYRHHVASMNGPREQVARYPGSAMLDLGEQVDVPERGGMTELRQALSSIEPDDAVVVHVDPYDPWEGGSSGWTALDLAAAVITAGVGLVYWYGYDRPADRGWPFAELTARAPGALLWSGDMLVVAAGGHGVGGHFGTATTPGTGCGVVCANISANAIQAAQHLGEELAIAYDVARCRTALVVTWTSL